MPRLIMAWLYRVFNSNFLFMSGFGMQKRIFPLANMTLVVIMFVLAALALYELPAGAVVTVHWDASGNPNGWMGKYPGLLAIPIISLVILKIASGFPDVNSSDLTVKTGLSIKPANKKMLFPFLAILLVAEVLVVVNALGHVVDPTFYIAVSVGVIFVIIGLNPQVVSFGIFPGRRRLLVVGDDHSQKVAMQLIRYTFILCGVLIVASQRILSDDWRAVGVVLFSIVIPIIIMTYLALKVRKSNNHS